MMWSRGELMALRVTGGILRGRKITVPNTVMRPTQDRVRAAVFSSLATWIPGARVLDLFAGSGSMGLEAYSRGASMITWVEADRNAVAVLRNNIRQLCEPTQDYRLSGVGASTPVLSEIHVIRDDAIRFLRRGTVPGPFDLVFADPPYDRNGEWLKKILSALSEGSMLIPQGLLVMELSARVSAVSREGWRLVKTRVYGETQICVYQKT